MKQHNIKSYVAEMLLFSVLFVLVFATSSLGIIISDTANATFDFPANETYVNDNRGNYSESKCHGYD